MPISDWSSDACSSDLADIEFATKHGPGRSPHNLPLANQFYGGLPATLLLAALLLLAAWQAWQTGRAEQKSRPVLLVLLVFGLTASLFDSRSLVQNLGREWIAVASHRPAGGPGVAAGLRPSHRHRPKHLATVTAAARAKRTAPGTELSAE